MLSANEIRQQFIDFFVKKHAHTFVPSSPVVPHDDPTLLFTNAGMNQFKPYFLGTARPPYQRAANTQKCIRAGGKHNDLDDVGKDTYHHTFFEMLGNWSFGDYFKKEAIQWAWELLTEVWKLDKSRLHATVFEGSPDEGVPRDDEAFEHWKTVTDIDHSHIHWGNKKDNFWEMGETGPCGPCTEIHYDRTDKGDGGQLVNAGRPEVIEIWNLVFIQFNRAADRKLSSLPAKHVDTGMGFERVTAVLQDKTSNYDTDVFTPIMDAISQLTGRTYRSSLPPENFGTVLTEEDIRVLTDTAFRVVADHIRTLTFALADGALPGNKGRGSVLRSVLRRAVRYSWQCFDQEEPFLYKLVPTVVQHMGHAFPELKQSAVRVAEIIKGEEVEFLKTIQRGLIHFENAVRRGHKLSNLTGHPGHPKYEKILGKHVFELHTTYGFPPDMTLQMARERGLPVEMDEYYELMKEHEDKSRVRKKMVISAVSGELPKTDDSPKYQGLRAEGSLLGWVKDNAVIRNGRLNADDEAAILLDRTNFYAEQGGQVGDVGVIVTPTGRFEVDDTQKLGDSVLHLGRVVEGTLEPGQKATIEVGDVRTHTMRNHTATHLLNWALRKVLGEHIDQKGSLVDAEKTRFDFAHTGPLSGDEVAEVERLVNERIYADLPVTATIMPLAEAKKIPGVRAVFGEKYPDPVRVLVIGADRPEKARPEHSVEFCGGTHLAHTGQAGFFKIVSQESVAKGVRRVTAVTGREAVATVQRLASVLDTLMGRFNCKAEEVPARVEQLQDEVKKLQQQLKKGAAGDLQGVTDKLLAEAAEVAGAKIIVGEVPAGDAEQIRQQVDRLRQKAGSAVVLLGWPDDGKVQLLAAVTDDLVKKGLHAGKLVGAVAKVVGGGGGGKPTMASAGGKDPAKLGEALQLARKLAAEQLTG